MRWLRQCALNDLMRWRNHALLIERDSPRSELLEPATDMKIPSNQRTGILALRVRDDLRLLSADTRTLLRQALSDSLPAAGRQILHTATDGLDRGRAWIVAGSRSIRRDERTPVVVGVVGLAVLAGAAWLLCSKFGCCSRDESLVEEEPLPDFGE